MNRKRGRRRKIIIEKYPRKYKKISLIVNNQLRFFDGRMFEQFEPYVSRRFTVELENDHLEIYIDPIRISGFKITDNSKDGKILSVNILLNVGEWIDDFCQMSIARILLLNNVGQSIKSFDYDIELLGHNFECNYNTTDILKPTILYKVID